MRVLTQLKCGWVPVTAVNKCMQRTEPCLDQHLHIISCACFKSHYGNIEIDKIALEFLDVFAVIGDMWYSLIFPL